MLANVLKGLGLELNVEPGAELEPSNLQSVRTTEAVRDATPAGRFRLLVSYEGHERSVPTKEQKPKSNCLTRA
jgi:hypothetical protein